MSTDVLDYIYQKEDAAPWTFKEPPKELVELVKNGLASCKMLDVGCGEGYISLYFASMGFDVTGMDASANAIALANKHARERGINCKFVKMNWKDVKGRYDFILDWRFLHEITDEKERRDYVSKISRLLRKKGTYVSVAFSGEFKKWGNGRLRKSPIGVMLCLSTNQELEKLFGEHFNILEKKMLKLPQKGLLGGAKGYFFLMKKSTS